MDVTLAVIIVVATAAVVAAGITFTVRGFRASARGDEKDRRPPAEPAAATASRHDHATTDALKRFFDGKSCAICKQPIPPVNRTGLKPGLWNPATRETHSWNEIPTGNLPATLQNQLPVCSSCQVAESFRKRFPDLVVDRDRSLQNAHAHDGGSRPS